MKHSLLFTFASVGMAVTVLPWMAAGQTAPGANPNPATSVDPALTQPAQPVQDTQVQQPTQPQAVITQEALGYLANPPALFQQLDIDSDGLLNYNEFSRIIVLASQASTVPVPVANGGAAGNNANTPYTPPLGVRPLNGRNGPYTPPPGVRPVGGGPNGGPYGPTTPAMNGGSPYTPTAPPPPSRPQQ